MINKKVIDTNNTLRALYEMIERVDDTQSKDENIKNIVETEIKKIDTKDMNTLMQVEPKYLEFFVNKKIEILLNQFDEEKGKGGDEKTFELERKRLLKLKQHVNFIKPTIINQ